MTEGQLLSSTSSLTVSRRSTVFQKSGSREGAVASNFVGAEPGRGPRNGERRTVGASLAGARTAPLTQLLPRPLPAELRRHRDQVISRLRATVLTVQPGKVDVAAMDPGNPGWAGLLLLEGLLLAQLDAGRARVGWLLGPEDLLRPCQVEVGLTRQTSWQALTAARVAVLDAHFVRRVAPVPGVMSELLARAQQTTHWLLAKSLLISSPSVEERLVLLFALFGERWGKVTREGVHLELPLTHALIACLAGARRPTVSTTLGTLQQKGIIKRNRQGGWLLCRGDEVAPRLSCWQQYADALGYW